MKFLYLCIDLCSVAVPFLFSFHSRLNFHKNFKAFFAANIISATIFIIWDILFTQKGVWGFNPEYITGIYLFNLPIEELLFFICIPFACVFTYHCLNLFYKIQWKAMTEAIFCLVFSIILLTSGIFFAVRSYTSVTFISTAVLLIIFRFIFKVNWLGKLFSIYPVLIIPFFIVNGILTGSGLQKPVVWYNDSENLGIRLLTIPLEDVIYGFELIMLNIFFYERFKSKINETN